MAVALSMLRAGDVGRQYVLLIDPATLETVDSVAAERQPDGHYRYRFTGVAPGTYHIFAGSDLNNDGFICDPGESCGAYLILEQPAFIEVNTHLDGLDFMSGFASNLPGSSAASIGPQPQRRFSRHRRQQLQR